MSKILAPKKPARQQPVSDLDRDILSAQWDLVRREASSVAWMYSGHENEKVRRWGARISTCAQQLTYEWLRCSDKQWRRRLRSARLCRVRTCPICRWRRSLKLKADTLDTVRSILHQRPTLRCVLLTLTVRNPQLTDLRDSLQLITRAWSKLTRRVVFRGVVGWIRSLEVTPGTIPGHAHPHLHALLLVDETWSAEDLRLSREIWCEEWREVCGLNYIPVCDVRPVASEGGIIEVLKYTVKPGDGSMDSSWLPAVALALDRVRVFAAGGLIRVSEPENEIEDELQGTVCDGPPFIPGVRSVGAGCQIMYRWSGKKYARDVVFFLSSHDIQIRQMLKQAERGG